jgi:heme exporter protein D
VSDYLQMGGYAAFVWPAYGLSALVMLGLVLVVWRDLRTNQRALARLQTARSAVDESS